VTAGVLIVVLLYRFASAQQRSKIDLEHEISERTAELRESLDYQTAVSDVLKAISRSTFDLGPVLQVGARHRDPLCRAQMAGIYQFQDGTFPLDGGQRRGPGAPGPADDGADGAGVGRPGGAGWRAARRHLDRRRLGARPTSRPMPARGSGWHHARPADDPRRPADRRAGARRARHRAVLRQADRARHGVRRPGRRSPSRTCA
jgi:hypothetical protein